MQLVAPVWVVVVLEHESLRDGGREGYLAAILAEGPAGPHGVVVLAPRHVVPPLDGDSREMDIASGYRMRPGFGGKVADGSLQHSAAGGELRSEPTMENRNRAHEAPVELEFVGVITFPRKTR